MFMTKLCLAVSKVRLLYAVICNTQEGKFKPGSGQLYIHAMQRMSEPDANTYSFSRVKKKNKAKSLHESKYKHTFAYKFNFVQLPTTFLVNCF